MIKLLIVVLYCTGDSALCGALPCISKDYGHGSTVCVCNSTYCDTIAPPQQTQPLQFFKYTSNKAGLRFHKEIGTFTSKTNAITTNTIHVYGEKTFQKIFGWGGAFTDAVGVNLNSLGDAARDKLLHSYFSEDGIEYSLCRVPIGGTDFSLRGYSYDDGTEDKNLTNFKLAPEDLQYKIPYIKKALNLTDGKLKLFASVWTAPKWAKTNGQYAGFLGFLKEDMYQTWANYFVKFLDSYRSKGINFWGITTGNEPSLALVPGNQINNVGWLPNNMATWITENLGPTIRNSIHKNVKIMMLDDQRLFLPWYPDQVLKNETTRKYIDGIAFHWYLNKFFRASLLTETHEHFPEKFILASEACVGVTLITKKIRLGYWDEAEDYANDIIEDLQNWVSGWVDWNMALNLAGGPTYINNFVNSPIIVNATSGEFYKNPTFYALGHFSKFVSRNSVRTYSNSTYFDASVVNVAFKRPDNSTVVVILNKHDADVKMALTDGLKGVAEMVLSPKSITTLLY